MTGLRVGDRVWVGVPANQTPAHILSIHHTRSGLIEYVVRTVDLAVHLPVSDPQTCWDFHMSHGFAARVEALNPTDAAAQAALAAAEKARAANAKSQDDFKERAANYQKLLKDGQIALTGKHFDDATVLRVAHTFEQAVGGFPAPQSATVARSA